MDYVVEVKKTPENKILVRFLSKNIVQDIRNIVNVETTARGIYIYVYERQYKFNRLVAALSLDDIKRLEQKQCLYNMYKSEDLLKQIQSLQKIVEEAWKRLKFLDKGH